MSFPSWEICKYDLLKLSEINHMKLREIFLRLVDPAFFFLKYEVYDGVFNLQRNIAI